MQGRSCWPFWDHQDTILEHYMPRGQSEQWTTNHIVISWWHIWSLPSEQNVVDCSQRVYYSNMTTPARICLVWQLQPSINFDLSVFHIDHIRPTLCHRTTTSLAVSRRIFGSNEDVKEAVYEWLRTRPKDFFSAGIQALPKRWRTCIEKHGDYTEKWYPIFQNISKIFKVIYWTSLVHI